ADIWSFGVVLWEMLTGLRMFQGETISHTLADVLRAPIDLTQLPKDTPPAIHTLLRRCLDREVKTRLGWIGEARFAIASANDAPAVPAPAPPRSKPWLIGALAAALLATASAAAYLSTRPAAQTPSVRFAIPVPPKTRQSNADLMAVSPDGRSIVFSSNPGTAIASNQLWIRRLDSLEIRPLSGTDGGHFPFWSPDSRFIGFWTGTGTRKIALDGSPAVALTRMPSAGGTWNRQGILLLGNFTGSVQQVPEGGGEEKPALKLDASQDERSQVFPQFLPDGKHFIYLSRGGRQPGIYLASLGSNETRRLIETPSHAVYAQGHLFYVNNLRTLVARPFDPAALTFTGDLFPVAERLGAAHPGVAGSLFSVSESGVLAYRDGGDITYSVTVFNRKGENLGVVGPPGEYAQITLSPDEKRLALDRTNQGANADIWFLELATGVFSRITSDPGNDRDPVFSPDGRQIVFTSDRLGAPHLYRKTLGGGAEELIYRGPNREASEVWLKDGSILFGNLRGRKYFLLRPGEPAEPKLIFQNEATVDEPTISPDGKWVAYGSMESGRWEAYVARFPEWDERRQISTDGGTTPHWRKDGREIVYHSSSSTLMSVPVKPGPGTLETGSPTPLFSTNSGGNGFVELWTMTGDASRFYVLTPIQSQSEFPTTVVTNWLAGVRK
ncbi:MAG TPA: hypothetical protein DEH78_04755, partial [Solibacterales bacterium]|nr:hypothetical protein [Bryobacterales bacterium]